jgi:hypothetical protein
MRRKMSARTVVVNDRMQKGYRYVLSAPIGRNQSGCRGAARPRDPERDAATMGLIRFRGHFPKGG